MDIITSLKNEKVKLTFGLQERPRTRRKERKIVLEGTRLVRDAMQRGHRPLFAFYDPKLVDYHLLAEFQQQNIEVLPANDEVMLHISDTQNPQGIVAVFNMPLPPLPKKPRRILILDNVRDPGNVGGILRSAGGAGVEAVVFSPGCADPYNPKALRSGMGAHFRIPVIEAGWEQIALYCEKLTVYLADAHGTKDYAQVDWAQPSALIIGSEAHGASAEALALNPVAITIPMSAETESLNAGVAAAVILFEAHRQTR